MQELAIVGIFYDGYIDLWEDFLELFFMHMKDCPYKLYIVNNTKEVSFEKDYDVSVLHAGQDAEYSRKVQYMLDNIDSKYYLLLLDDFFIGDDVSINELMDLMNDIKKYNISNCTMPYRKVPCKNKYKQHPFLYEMSPKRDYTVNCQPAIWERDFLRRCIGKENYNAWIFEGIYGKAKVAHTESFLCNCCIDNRNILNIKHGAVQGKMLPETMSFFESVNYQMKNDRDILSKRTILQRKIKERLSELPVPIKKQLRKLKKNSSVIDKYDDQIEYYMKRMGIE